MKSNVMKVYRINDCDWVAATSLGEALAFYQRHTDIDDDMLIDSQWLPKEVSKEKMDEEIFIDREGEFGEEYGKLTFTRALELEMERADTEQPFLFASTEY